MQKSNRVVNNKHFLLLIANCKKKLRNSIINSCSKEEILAILECILNISNGNIDLSSDNFNKLKPFNKTFKKLINKRIPIKQKRSILVQKGGFLQFLVPAIVSGIATIISSVISRPHNAE